jgi:hypothetical protein
MSDNVLQTLQQLIQDVIAPDVRELKVRVSSLEKQMDVRFDAVDVRFGAVDVRFDALEARVDTRFAAMDARFDALEARMDDRFHALDQKIDLRFDAILSALREFKAETELSSVRMVSALSERVAVLETQRQ